MFTSKFRYVIITPLKQTKAKNDMKKYSVEFEDESKSVFTSWVKAKKSMESYAGCRLANVASSKRLLNEFGDEVFRNVIGLRFEVVKLI